jgi:hypothetical protein
MPSNEGEQSWAWDRLMLVAAGLAAFVLGTSVHSDRSNLAVALVGCGVLLLLLAALLPRLQSISGKLPGAEFSLGLLPPSPSVSDQVLVRPLGEPGPGSRSEDLRGAAPFASGASGFGQAIKGGPATFVTISLEHGRAWLSSRLYVFLQALREVRGIEAVVFTERTQQIDQFVGVAGVDEVITRLEWAFPWLAEAFGKAWQDARQSDPNRPARRRLSPDVAETMYHSYVAELREPQKGDQPQEWQQLRDGLWERANWLDQATVKELLGDALLVEYVIGSLDREQTLNQAIAIGTARWIAVVDHNLATPSVVDRWKLLDRALRRNT